MLQQLKVWLQPKNLLFYNSGYFSFSQAFQLNTLQVSIFPSIFASTEWIWIDRFLINLGVSPD